MKIGQLRIKQEYEISYDQLNNFFEEVFNDGEDSQKLDEWISINQIIQNLHKGCLLVARIEDEIVGVAFLDKSSNYTYEDGKKLEIVIIGTKKEFRNLKIASKLIDESIKYGKEAKASKIIANTHIDSLEAHNFYMKNGFEKIGILRDYYSNGDAVFFVKNIV